MSWIDEYLTQQQAASGSSDPYAGGGPPPEDEGFLHSLGRVVAPPLAWLGETIDKTLGARTLRELLAGKGASSFLHMIPGSDTFGLTDPTKAATGRDLGRQWGIMDQEDTTGNFWGGLGLEIGLDPSNLLTLGTKGALTAGLRGGKAALMAGTLEKTAAGRIAAGQAGLASVHTPWFTNMLGLPKAELTLGTGARSQALAEALGKGVDRLYDVPVLGNLMGKTVSAFDYMRGHTGDPRYARATAGLDDVEQSLRAQLGEKYMPVLEKQTEAFRALDDLGIPRAEGEQAFKRLYNSHIEGTDLSSPYFASLPDAASRAQAASQLDTIAQAAAGEGRQFYDSAAELFGKHGIKVGENKSLWLNEYAHQRSGEAGRSMFSQQTKRSLPHDVLWGGANQVDDLVNDSGISGLLRRKAAGAPLDEAAAKQAIEQFAQDHAQKTMMRRDMLVQAAAGQPLSPQLTEQLAKLGALTDEKILAKSRGLGRWLGELDPGLAEAGRGFYRPDPAGLAMEYAQNAASQATTAKGVMRTLAKEARPTDAARLGVEDAGQFVTLRRVLDDLGLNAADVTKVGKRKAYNYGGKLTLLDELREAGRTGLQSNLKTVVDKELDRFAVPRDLVDVLRKEKEGPKAGRASGLREGLDKYGSAIRSWLTVVAPPYHLRNFGEAQLQQAMAGTLSPQATREAALYRAGAITDPALAAKMEGRAKEAIIHGAAFNSQAVEQLGKPVAELAGKRAIDPLPAQIPGNTIAGKAKEWLNRFRPGQLPEGEQYMMADKGAGRFVPNLDPSTSPLVQRGVEAHIETDQVNRFAQFNALRDQGYAPAAAAKAVRESQLDYTRLTPFERDLRRLMPFYSFSKENLRRTVRQLGDPGPLATLVRAANEARQGTTVPDYVTPGMAVPIGKTEDGKQRYLSGFGMPVEDEMLGAATSLISGHPQEAARRVLSGADPLLKMLVEGGTDTQLYSGRKLSEQRPTQVASLGGLLPDPIARTFASALSATPLSRVVGNVDKAAGVATGQKTPDALLSILLGTRVSEVDPAQAANAAARQAIDASLTGSGLVSSRKELYLRPEFKNQDTPEVQGVESMLKLKRDLEESNRRRRQAEAAQQGYSSVP